MNERNSAAEAQLFETVQRLEQAGAAHNRASYEWEAEREELVRERSEAQASTDDLHNSIEEGKRREAELREQCAGSGDKLAQMRKIMDDQEREMNMKIDRVEQYVKERQAGALVAEKKQQDAERMADRWQREVQRLQGEKDRFAA